MIKISKQNNSLIVEGIENAFYINNGDNSYPLNSLIVVTDNSDMATFRSVATNDVLFSGLIQNITINGEAVTKDDIIDKFDAVSNSSDVYTKEEADNKFASKDELANVQTVANNADTKVDALTTRVEGVETVANNADAKADAATSRIESVETAMGNKQDTLVSGTNIKTVNSQSILGEGNLEVSGVSEEQAQEIAKIPTLETEIAQKANVSDIPTVQTDNTGTNKNYIYSNFASSNHKYNVISALANGSKSADKYSLLLRTWGPVSAYHNFDINAATTTAAGVMSAADKTKLDSISNEWTGTQSEYDALTTKDNNTIYYVTE